MRRVPLAVHNNILAEDRIYYNMKFSQWFYENEVPVMALPDPKKYYLACVLDPLSQQHLIGIAEKVYAEQMQAAIPRGWVFKAHHMTVNFRPSLQDLQKMQALFGQDVTLRVKSIGWDDSCIAAVVENDSHVVSTNAVPHITIAHSPSVSAEYSNTMLASKKNWKPNTEDHTHLGSIFLGVLKYDATRVWPEVGHPLAAPSFVS
jgi:hypothetical protein